MTGTIRRGKATRADLALWDGVNATYSRPDSTGGTTSGLRIGNEVDVLQVYGAGTDRSVSTLMAAIAGVGSADCTFVFAPGEWPIASSISIPSNIACEFPRGAMLTPGSGVTITISGPVIAGAWKTFKLSADGTVSVRCMDRYPEWWGALGDGTTDDTTAIQAAFTSLVAGGRVYFRVAIYRITSKVTIADVDGGVSLLGVGPATSDSFGSTILCDTGTSDSIEFNNVNGATIRGLRITGTGLSGSPYLLSFQNGVSNVEVADSRIVNGVGAVKMQDVNTGRFRNTTIASFTGSQCVLMNGVDASNRADPIEFTNCSISAGASNTTTDNVVVDGTGGSLKFIGCAILTGRHGVWFKNTTGVGDPFFLYVTGGGFENGAGSPIKLDAGSKVFIGGSAYLSSDGPEPGISVGSGFDGEGVISGAYIRGNGRSGIDFAAGGWTVSGCKIVNNGADGASGNSFSVSNAEDNGSGAIRITTSSAHGFRTGDRARITGVTGTVEANGEWNITLVSTTAFDLDGSTFANAYVSGGSTFFLSYGIRIRSGVSGICAVGNHIGASLDGGNNNQDYGILDESTGNITEPNLHYSNVTGDVLRTNSNRNAGTGLSRFAHVNRLINGNFGVIQRGGSALAVSDDQYGPDRWNLLAQSNPIQFDQLSIPYNGTRKACRITQSNAAAQRFGFEQIIEGGDCIDLRGRTVTFGGRYRCSVAQQTLRLFILEWTGTEDSVTSDVVLSWASTTFTTNSFFINSTLSINGPNSYTTIKDTWVDFKYTVTLGALFNNLIVFGYLSGTQAQNTTLDLSELYLVPGDRTLYPYNARPFQAEKALCDRFYWTGAVYVPATTAQNLRTLNMRSTPTITGGGAGFDSTGTTKDSLIGFQTGGAVQTLALNAEL